ncbi:SFB3 [Candida margitis]|uniref:SFB3 n=1 Tax=Candida margitis TaxID=1775924 RepID=UPI002227A913|nr:SFB3 [Candida margitis]KAI5954031.1 SFB3 [Candida margitis]
MSFANSNELSQNLQALDLNNQQPSSHSSKKRSRRAFHTNFNSPVATAAPTVAPTPAPINSSGVPQAPNFSDSLNAQVHGSQYPPQTQSVSVSYESHNAQQSVPSLQSFRYLAQKEYDTPNEEGNYKSFLTFSETVPPDAGVQFHFTDQGTASSKYMRSTMYYVPESEKLRSASKLPVAITIRPFAPLLETEEPVPTVDYQNDVNPEIASDNEDPLSKGPLRCHRCRAYVNSSMQFTHNQRFICNICQFANNDVPPEYASALDARGFRIDKLVRPELHKSVYDMRVPKEYNFGDSHKTPEPLHIVFLVDISENSIKQSLPILVSESIRTTLFNYKEGASEIPAPYKIAIMAFDKKLHFFNLSHRLERTQISISSDLEDPFVPFDEGLFVDPVESQFVIEDALNYLEQLCNSETHAFDLEPCFAVACKTAGMCLEMHGGGKIVSVLSNLPSWGPGGLTYKDNKAVGRTPAPEVEKKIFLPNSEYYKSMTKYFIQSGVGLDLHVASHASVDLSNLGFLVSSTGGELTRWPNLNYERDGRLFIAKFKNSVVNTTGYQGQLKLRCSNGLQVIDYYGTSSSIKDTSILGSVQDPVIPVLSKDHTFTVLLQYDGILSRKLDCHFQAALLYTDNYGQRKVRVINLVLAVTNKLEDVFNFADENAIVATLVRDTLNFVGQQTLVELRESLNTRLVDVFSQYRAMTEYGHNRAKTLSNNLLFPDSLKHLPIYILSFLKTHSINASTGLSADARLVDLFNMLNMPLERLMYHLYPALIEIHSLAPEEGTIDEATGFTRLPEYKGLSLKSLDRGVYILCDGVRVYVWLDPEASIMLIKDLFGEQYETIDEIDAFMDELPELPSEISQQACNLVQFLNKQIVGVQSSAVQIIRKGIDGSEHSFKEFLREDAFGGAMKATNGISFSEYLTSLHKAIKVQLESDKASQAIRQSISTVEHDAGTLAQRFINF